VDENMQFVRFPARNP